MHVGDGVGKELGTSKLKIGSSRNRVRGAWTVVFRCKTTCERRMKIKQLQGLLEMERVCFVLTCKVILWNHCKNQSADGCPVKHVIFVVVTRAF